MLRGFARGLYKWGNSLGVRQRVGAGRLSLASIGQALVGGRVFFSQRRKKDDVGVKCSWFYILRSWVFERRVGAPWSARAVRRDWHWKPRNTLHRRPVVHNVFNAIYLFIYTGTYNALTVIMAGGEWTIKYNIAEEKKNVAGVAERMPNFLGPMPLTKASVLARTRWLFSLVLLTMVERRWAPSAGAPRLLYLDSIVRGSPSLTLVSTCMGSHIITNLLSGIGQDSFRKWGRVQCHGNRNIAAL